MEHDLFADMADQSFEKALKQMEKAAEADGVEETTYYCAAAHIAALREVTRLLYKVHDDLMDIRLRLSK